MCSDYIILGKQSVGVGCVVGCVGREQPAPCWPCAPASRDWGAGSESAAPQLGLDLVCPPCFERGSPTRAGLDSPTWTGPRLTSSAPAAGVLPPFYSDLVSAQKKWSIWQFMLLVLWADKSWNIFPSLVGRYNYLFPARIFSKYYINLLDPT